ncbi:MAG: hypothetical protein FWD47_00610 [Treponema sp.]|nr:hypothetical protein [Treponema sp.]
MPSSDPLLKTTDAFELISDVPAEVLSNPALLFLYYRIDQILGIKATADGLKNLNNYLINYCGASFIENPAAYEYLLTSREQIYNISKYLTINETYFFREGAHFNLLINMLPDFAKLGRPLKVCSAAVSIGCEAYSIAMLLEYYSKKENNFDFTIDAFDINADAIETAKSARYTLNTIRSDITPWKHILDLYIIPDNNEFIVSQSIRSKVHFFSHNIMRGLEKQYDIIFFRNSLIYFSTKNRLSVLNNLAESLFNNGILFLGVSETASVDHPLLLNRFSSDVFYFQKTSINSGYEFKPVKKQTVEIKTKTKTKLKPEKTDNEKIHIIKKTETLSVNCAEITEIIKTDEGVKNTESVINALESDKINLVSGSSLAACIMNLLNKQDFKKAGIILSLLEKNNTSPYTNFLRGEYYFLQNIYEEAEKHYYEAAIKNKFFWPAFYRISCLTSDGNKTRHEYKIKKTIESIELLLKQKHTGEHNYECFMGGFSPDYFLRILEKKLT